ncbi:MAG: hypothetical protein AAGD43_37180 [Pseudomonadota bacterium]
MTREKQNLPAYRTFAEQLFDAAVHVSVTPIVALEIELALLVE